MRRFRIGFSCLILFIVLASVTFPGKGQVHTEESSNITDGAFVFKSIDGGASWKAIVDFNSGLNAHKAQVISIDPIASSTIYVGTNNGIARTIDGGDRWRAIDNGLSDLNIKNIAIDYINSSNLYAFIQSRDAIWGGIFKSSDAGINWSRTGLDQFAFSLAIDPATPSVLYAGGIRFDHAGIYKSTNGGRNWNFARVGSLAFTASVNNLAFDQLSPNIFYASNTSGPNDGGLFRSTDRGRTWRGTNLDEITIHSVAIDPQTSSKLYVVSSEGLLKSTNGGDSWVDVTNGLPRSGIQCLAIDPTNPAILFAGTRDGLFRSADEGESWILITLNRSIFSLAIDSTDPSVIYAGGVAASPRITSASVDGKKLIVAGEEFHIGATIYVDGKKQKTINDVEQPHATLIGKKAGKKIVRGQTVSISVVDVDGTVSQPFSFRRPNE